MLVRFARTLGSPQLSVKSLLNTSTRRNAMSKPENFSTAAAAPPADGDIAFVLASQSPNRLKLCEQMGLAPTVRVSAFEENLPKDLPVREFVEQTALGKLEVVEKEMRQNKERFDVIVAADTVIYDSGEIIGKPIDAKDAFVTLQRLRNNSHYVYTGVAMAFADQSREVFSVETKVTFGDFSDDLIEQYVASGEPLTKAGSYSIKQKGAVFVKGIDGCFSNVVGLPINALAEAFSKHGVRFMH